MYEYYYITQGIQLYKSRQKIVTFLICKVCAKILINLVTACCVKRYLIRERQDHTKGKCQFVTFCFKILF